MGLTIAKRARGAKPPGLLVLKPSREKQDDDDDQDDAEDKRS